MVIRYESHLGIHSPKGRRIISRRLSDKRLWEQIEKTGLGKAAYCLMRGFAYLCWSGNTRAIRWQEVRGSFYDAYSNFDDETLEFLSRCKRDYLAWCRCCEEQRLNHRAVIEVLYFGKSLSAVDKAYGRRHGWAHQTILESLLLYRK